MEERSRSWTMWIALGVLALLGLCALLFFGLVFVLAARSGGPVSVVPQAVPAPGQSGGTVPQVIYGSRWGGLGLLFAPFRCLLPLLFFGLISLLIFRLAGRRCWHHAMWGGYWGPPPWAQPGGEGPGRPQAGPHGWHRHGGSWGGPWGPPPGARPPAREEGQPDRPPAEDL